MSAVLSVIVPIQITDANLVSSTVPETDHPVWLASSTYGIGDRVILAHRIYECMRAGNVGKDPRSEINRASPTPWWQDMAPTNRYAAFDNEVSTTTVATGSMTMVIRPGAFSAVFLAGIDAEQLTITIRDSVGGAVIYNHVDSLEGSAPADYLEYYYDRFKPASDFIVTGLDPYNASEITITLSRSSGEVKCGVLALGDQRPLGLTQYGATAEPKSYSYIKTDEFGKTTIRKRKAAKDMTASAIVPLEEANSVLEVLTETMGVPCVWIGTDIPEYAGLRVFGLGNGKLSYDEYLQANLSLTVKGLI